MNMKLKRILSSALVVIMLFSAVVLAAPINASAAHYATVDENKLSDDEVQAIVQEYRKASFTSAEEMFQYDLSMGYLDYATNVEYTIYVNRYTGVMYYRNEYTGAMLTSNSYNFGSADIKSSSPWASQVTISYSKVTDTTFDGTLHSSEWAAERNQIQVSKIENGIRVNYAIGTAAGRCLLPVWIEAHELENDILRPLFGQLYNEMVEKLGEKYALDYFGGNRKEYYSSSKTVYETDTPYYDAEEVYSNRYLHDDSLRFFWEDFDAMIKAYNASKGNTGSTLPEVKELQNLLSEIRILYEAYRPLNPTHPKFQIGTDMPEKVSEGMIMYVVKVATYDQMADKAKTVKKYCPDYNFEKMYESEARCGYEHQYESNPLFRCSLDYTFNEDGSLSVRLPSNSIVFDETEYILKSITPLKYFGSASFEGEGYIFVPDGSGSIIEFEDFRQSNVTMGAGVSFYGTDYCYSMISGAHKQHLTMPVYGVVSEKDVAGNDVNVGYFAILEEGSSMATINTLHETTLYKDGTVYTSFTPYPTDRFDLSDTVSVGDNSFYTKVSESKYSGSYVTRYVMLAGESANYVGMAAYYRNYLEKNGVLTELTSISDDLPLYLEALGSLDVVEKIMTFPVTVSKPITTFEDLVAIYDDLGRAKERMLEKAAEYEALAAAEEDNAHLRADYLNTAAEYRRLAETVVNIDNVNFKLTGFSNGGLTSTYPTKVKWERSLGGRRGFKKLLKTAAEKTTATSNFGVYPDFDFQYISNTSLFDGVGKNNTVSRMVDNRYASKQVYSNITGEYKTNFSMIVSADALDRLYNKFIKKYSKYDATGISVSTLGSDLNSNFDEKNPVSRDDAQGYVTALLDRIANESNYDVMTTQGNIYSVKYATHILNVCTDSSYYRYSSYTVPFVGMILHGYVNYTGTALNYSGAPDYDLLRSIENGAALYYIIGYRNTDVLKDDEDFNKYYSVSYDNWFDDIVEKYSILNAQLGNLQDYKLVSHEVLIGERVIDEQEQVANLQALMDEFVAAFKSKLVYEIDKKLAELDNEGNNKEKQIGVAADINALMTSAYAQFGYAEDGSDVPAEYAAMFTAFRAQLEATLAKFVNDYSAATEFTGDGVDPNVSVSELSYESKYQYVTNSTARDDDYDHTDYTVDNDLIVMVTYQHKDGRKTSFILNYNLYSVEVTLEEGADPYVLNKYGFVRIDH